MPGVCRLGDRSKAPVDVHGCPACPHKDVIGPSISGSSNVFVNGAPALRLDDIGMHATCCGTNMWKVIGASGTVFVNGSQIVRQGDPTLHCGGPGKMVDASANVSDGSPVMQKQPFAAFTPQPPLPLNQVLVFPAYENECISPNNRGGMVQTPGLPTTGDAQVYDAAAAERAIAANLPHAEAGPSKDQQAASQRKLAALNWIAGNEDGYKEHTEEANRLKHQASLDALKEQLATVQELLHQHGENKEKLEKQERDIKNAFETNKRNGIESEPVPEGDPDIEDGL